MSPAQSSGTTDGGKTANGLPKLDVATLFDFKNVDIPTGDEIYDRIMSGINPELMSKNVSSLKAKYQNESPELKKQRADRYNKDFAEYERQYAQFRSSRDVTMHCYKAEALKSLEAKEREAEASDVLDLEQQILSI